MIHRKTIRLDEYDYSVAGSYFVTMRTQNRAELFGEIVNGKMISNRVGWMVEKWWRELLNKFHSISLDYFVVMPNHLHGIIQIVGAELWVCSIEKVNRLVLSYKYDKLRTNVQ